MYFVLPIKIHIYSKQHFPYMTMFRISHIFHISEMLKAKRKRNTNKNCVQNVIRTRISYIILFYVRCYELCSNFLDTTNSSK